VSFKGDIERALPHPPGKRSLVENTRMVNVYCGIGEEMDPKKLVKS
jgi:hypothetical protein